MSNAGEGVIDWSVADNAEMEQKVGKGFKDKLHCYFEEVCLMAEYLSLLVNYLG